MRFKFIFWLIFALVFGSLVALGIYFTTTNITLFLIIEGITLLTGILFVLFYRTLLKPYRIISEGMDLLKQQDFSSRLRPVGLKETDQMIEVFNRMMDQLKEERLQVREQNRFLDLLINASPMGLVILDFDEQITQINPAGLRLLNIESPDQVIGKTPETSGISIGKQLSALHPGEDTVLRISGIMRYRCIRSFFLDRGFSHPFILIEELTHEVLDIEKKSYESIIRMMAHEVNNSMAAISSTLDVMSDHLQGQEDNEPLELLPAVQASFERCLHLSRFITNFAEVVKIPAPVRSLTDLNALAQSTRAFWSRECELRNIKLELITGNTPHMANIDGILLEQALINIVKNAYESIGTNGAHYHRQPPAPDYRRRRWPRPPGSFERKTVYSFLLHKTTGTRNRIDVCKGSTAQSSA